MRRQPNLAITRIWTDRVSLRAEADISRRALPLRRFSSGREYSRLTIRLSDAGLRQRQTELLNPNHRPSPWPTEDAGSRARSSRLLGANTASSRRAARFVHVRAYSAHA